MKTIFVPAKVKAKINERKVLELSERLPRELAIVYSIQFKDVAESVKNVLSKRNNITKFAQVLGCSSLSFPEETQAVLLIGEGRFHAISLSAESELPVFILNNNKLEKIPVQEIELFQRKKKAAYVNYLNSKKIGVIVSTKPGQQKLKKVLSFLDQKKSYIFISNTVDVAEFENFSDIGSWVNTSCPRMDMNSNKIVNLKDLNLSDRKN